MLGAGDRLVCFSNLLQREACNAQLSTDSCNPRDRRIHFRLYFNIMEKTAYPSVKCFHLFIFGSQGNELVIL